MCNSRHDVAATLVILDLRLQLHNHSCRIIVHVPDLFCGAVTTLKYSLSRVVNFYSENQVSGTRVHIHTSLAKQVRFSQHHRLPCIQCKAESVQGLNVNGGQGKCSEIRVRLRPHHSPDSFYPYEDILGTMLHEIVHNVRGPHDSEFYKTLDEVTAECEELISKGISGTTVGFDGPSCGRLGSRNGFCPLRTTPAEMKASQLKCAPRCTVILLHAALQLFLCLHLGHQHCNNVSMST
jgi:hypothetical protein